MQRFFLKIGLYLVLLAGVVLIYIAYIYVRPDFVDAFYPRFTTPHAKSLIVGTSRSAQGIVPMVINDRIDLYENSMVNHSFAVGPSSFGPNYYREILQKTDPETKNGLFIISVDPWSLTTQNSNIEDDTSLFYEVENKMFTGNLSSSTQNPNISYLEDYWKNRFTPIEAGFKSLIGYHTSLLVQDDGWLKVKIPYNLKVFEKRIIESTEEYSLWDVKLSDKRFDYLEGIIDYFSDKGTVILVRMPVSKMMADLEFEKFEDFDSRIIELANAKQVRYFNFIGNSGEYVTIDTHHLYLKESIRFTERLCDSLEVYLQQ